MGNLREILIKNRRVFRECPGRIEGYEHEFQVTDRTPYFQRGWPVPVSYTHLVTYVCVFRKQRTNCILLLCVFLLCMYLQDIVTYLNNSINILCYTETTVSYTHLDVYKRQVIDNIPGVHLCPLKPWLQIISYFYSRY